MQEKKSSKKIIIAVVILVVIIAAFALVFLFFGPKAKKGTKAYELIVTDSTGSSVTYEGKTDAEFLRELMDEVAENEDFSYDGSDSEYGLYIMTVNGETADFDTDGAYWAIYVNGEYGLLAADAQPVNDGDSFELKYDAY